MPERTCPLCGEALLPGEGTLAPLFGWEDEAGGSLAPIDRHPEHAIHARCELADPEAAQALLDRATD